MMHTHKGVTLFECLIYLALFSFIATSGMFIVARLWQSCIAGAAFERSSLSVYSAFDALAREMRCAPAVRSQWKLISSTALIWPLKGDKDCGWAFQKGKLVRTEGTYNPSCAQWKNKSSTHVAPLTQVQFTCHCTTHISQVDVHLADEITKMDGVVGIRNRIVYE